MCTYAIGISNANASLLSQTLPKMKAKPSVNQYSHSIGTHNSSHVKSVVVIHFARYYYYYYWKY